MTTDSSWRGCMPRAFHWLEGLQVETVTGLVDGALHITPVITGKKDEELRIDAEMLPTAVSTELKHTCKETGWSGKGGTFFTSAGGHHFLLVPLSKLPISKMRIARQAGLDSAKGLGNFKFERLVICASQTNPLEIFDGLAMGLYGMKFNHTPAGGKDKATLPAQVQIFGDVSETDINRTKELARAVIIARTMQDAPANWLTSVKLGEIAEEIAAGLPALSCRVVDKAGLEELGMGSFLSVSQGSVIEPRMIVFEVEGNDPSQRVALIGKGITFDSGGISIKQGAGMAEMKYDMSGAAAVLGTMCFLAQEKPAVNVVGLIGATENMPSATATRPGDVVTAMNDVSIEVLNTDAEGRLVLADLICYAKKNYRPKLIIDIATLTGAVIYALGKNGAGLMSNNQDSAQRVLNAAERAGEPIWQLPLWPELKKEVKGTHADVQNITAPNVKAGTITAAWFLEKFVGDTPWTHLDVAGTAWDCKAVGFPQKSSCAFGIRTMAEVCRSTH